MTTSDAIEVLREMERMTAYSGERGGLAVDMAVEALQDACLDHPATRTGDQVSDDLEDEIGNYIISRRKVNKDIDWRESGIALEPDQIVDFARHFAGWQRQKMIKDAVEATVHGVSGREGSTMKGIAVTAYADVPACKFGDKVKLIIIKED